MVEADVSDVSCLWSECDRPAQFRSLCSRCYARAKRAGRLDEFGRERECLLCGQGFALPPRSRRLYCGAACRARTHLERHGSWRTACEACDRPIDKAKRQDSRFCSVDCQKMAITHLRRAALLSAEAEPISVAGVVDRYGTDCSICGNAIDMDLVRPNLMSFSIDHVVSLARGGSHTYANVAPAHLLCNMQKGDRALVS